jgi:hypothetical protein
METNFSPKIPNYYCEICKTKTNNKKDYDKHILTSKHKKLTVVNTSLTHFSPKEENPKFFACQNCNKIYKSRVGLWKHKNKCDETSAVTCKLIDTGKLVDTNETDAEINNKAYNDISDKELIVMLIKQNAELVKETTDFKNMMMKVLENGTHNNSHNTTNSHNKAFNLQFFLNETCKDAMNIMDFVESIQLQLSDLEKVGELGYVEGISNIIVKNLNELDVTQRPVHCTDKKRETIYIKDENKWEKDDEKNKIRKMIKRVASKNQRLLLKFKEMHPDCIKYHSKYSDQYNKLIVESMGGSGNNDLEKEDKIIRNIAKNVTIEK